MTRPAAGGRHIHLDAAGGRHIHLDAIGGVAGDMFVAAVLDAFPALAAPCLDAVRHLVGGAAEIALAPAVSHGFRGARLAVTPRPDHHHHHQHDHQHRAWAEIAGEIAAAPLPPGARDAALGIFRGLAEAEAAVHGVPVESVHFHEVGAIDSIADIVAAGWLIDALGASGWSVGPLPLGSGTARTAHGPIPVPAPATVRLLRGFVVVDDDLPGERVTPTGAAILAHLAPAARRPAGRLGATGLGLGTRDLPDRANGLRLLEIRLDAADALRAEEVAVLRFDIDDQTGEDLAVALDRLRAEAGVIDVTQAPAIGKKGRMAVQVRLLAVPDRAEAVADAVFRETTTLGLRLAREERRVLPRDGVTADGIRVKRARRPGGATAKAEIGDLAGDAAARARRRAAAEAAALVQPWPEEGT